MSGSSDSTQRYAFSSYLIDRLTSYIWLLQVVKFQPFYVFNKSRHMNDLRVGAEILKEALERENTIKDKVDKAAVSSKSTPSVTVSLNANDRLLRRMWRSALRPLPTNACQLVLSWD